MFIISVFERMRDSQNDMSSSFSSKLNTENKNLSTNNWSNLNLNWMDNNTVMSSDMSTLEGYIADDKNTKSNPTNGLRIDGMNQEWDTLDEPIRDTLMRDIKSIYTKLKFIIVPISSSDTYKYVLKDWDLWGPLILCTFMALTLHHNEEQSKSGMTLVGPHFAEIFVLIWFGNCLVSINYKLLNSSSRRRDKSSPIGSSPSTFQLLCVFGYCLAPPSLGIILLKLVSVFLNLQIKYLFIEKFLVGILFGFVWPTFSSVRILSKYQEKDKRLLAIYPIGLFYFVLSWAIITSH